MHKKIASAFLLGLLIILSGCNGTEDEDAKIDGPITSIALGRNHSSALSSEGNVVSWGFGEHGALGTGDESDESIPVDVTDQFKLDGDDTIEMLAAGTKHHAALSRKGNVYLWGKHFSEWLEEDRDTYLYSPEDITDQFELNDGERIVRVDVASFTFAALTSDNQVYTWGGGYIGRLGTGSEEDEPKPVNITDNFALEEGDVITDVQLSMQNGAAMSEQGELFMWGYGKSGHLGDGENEHSSTPVNMTEHLDFESGDSLKSFALSDNYTLALSQEGRVYSWGYGNKGQLGSGSKEEALTPVEITDQFDLSSGETIEQITTGPSNAGALSDSGNVYTWGMGYGGRLGNDDTEDHSTPQRITEHFDLEEDEHIDELEAGSSHYAALSNQNEVYMWGQGRFGRLGNDSEENQHTPINITDHFDFAETE